MARFQIAISVITKQPAFRTEAKMFTDKIEALRELVVQRDLVLHQKRLDSRRHAVIVVAEGAGQDYFTQSPRSKDASGNIKLGDIGVLIKERLLQHFKTTSRGGAVKYIDPSYIIRAKAANPADQLFCGRLAQDAVHAAMAGKTSMLIGYWHGRLTHVPLAALGPGRQSINPNGELWFNVLETTGQPSQIGTAP